ncbi:hypothetical protein WV31_18815 [Magnetospirillum sp. ME-1]|uniref:class I SAM-dependent methyltransferase n=1 Tax=Magnetospirillum sp. ME-1 TaxID=1639348 RepID=UPI000A17D9C3|nr:methyltransferase domain-containing protein [Magnetospirillum sp. ME-1]ARJ67563.1 hypothetical protein WV31_18815 [Magnetospirillum sp. ME-1]
MAPKKKSASPRKLNLGCGRDVREGWTNLDVMPLPGVDVVADLGRCATTPLPFEDDTFDELLLSHLLEHIAEPLPLMQELWRIAKPGAKMQIRVPHGAHDDAWTDPTHVKPYFARSFGYFSQPWYWRADYGYRGDWQPELVTYSVARRRFNGMMPQQVLEQIDALRNVVSEMVVDLVAVKPLRQPRKELMQAANIKIALVE